MTPARSPGAPTPAAARPPRSSPPPEGRRPQPSGPSPFSAGTRMELCPALIAAHGKRIGSAHRGSNPTTRAKRAGYRLIVHSRGAAATPREALGLGERTPGTSGDAGTHRGRGSRRRVLSSTRFGAFAGSSEGWRGLGPRPIHLRLPLHLHAQVPSSAGARRTRSAQPEVVLRILRYTTDKS